MLIFRQLFDPSSSTYTYLLGSNGEALLIDPVFEQARRDTALIDELGLQLVTTLESHVHADHITAAWLHRQRSASRIALALASNAEGADVYLKHGDQVAFGNRHLQVRATPGHTDGCLSFVLDDESMAFTGDCLLIRGSGRTDFQQGDAHTMFRSVHTQLLTLPGTCLLYPAHDYRGLTVTSVAEERRYNPRLGGDISESDFVGYMQNLNLPHPKQIAAAVPANLHCGIVPPTSMSGDPLPERGWAAIGRTPDGTPEVTIGWVDENKGAIRMVDVREIDEAESDGQIDGVEVIPMGTVDEASKSWDKEEPVITICRSGRRSGRVALELEKLGFKRIASMRGGMVAWQNQ